MCYLSKNTHIFFDVVDYYPEYDILGLGELYLSRNIQLDIPKGYNFWDNGLGDKITSCFLTKKHLKQNISLASLFINCSAIKLNLGKKKRQMVTII